MPWPSKDESEQDFVSRCMGDSEARSSFPDQKQRAAFCYSRFSQKHKSNQQAKANADLALAIATGDFQKSLADALKINFNENHDPANGEFS